MISSKISLSELKTIAARKAMEFLVQNQKSDAFLGIGTGSTIDFLIEELASLPGLAKAYVSSSNRTTKLLNQAGLPVIPCEGIEYLQFYVDGADEIDLRGCMIKGGGGALTREKIIAEIADEYLCIATSEKEVSTLGKFALPIEVIAQAESLIKSKLFSLDHRGLFAKTRLSSNQSIYLTDNGNPIIDVSGLEIHDPVALEKEINSWPGVVTVGLFAHRHANRAFLGSESGVLYREYI